MNDARLLTLLTSSRSEGWPYYPGKQPRLEPTCWNLLALTSSGAFPDRVRAGHDRLAAWQRTTGWLQEAPLFPVNIGFNALAAFTWFSLGDSPSNDQRGRLLDALISAKGIRVASSPTGPQDNTLQGWAWVDGTFSWVEPTCWGLLALKQARRKGVERPATEARIDEAERLLINRVCRDGGWNFGNASVMDQDLRPYVPTTALALLAMQDRRSESAVTRSLAWLEAHWPDEPSAAATGLTLLCLDAYGRPVDKVETALKAQVPAIEQFGNLHGAAIALTALARGKTNVFKL